MAKEKAPAFQFYPKDFLTDERVRLMSHTERGVYITLLSLCWLEGSLPATMPALAKMVELSPARFQKLWTGPIGECFRPNGDGRLIHKRLEEERVKQETFRRRASDGGRAAISRRGADGRFSTRVAGAKHQPDDRVPAGDLPPGSTSSPISNLLSSKEKEKSASLSPAAPSADHGGHGPEGHGDPRRDPFTDPQITKRAGRFVERYQALYPQHRHGARYALKPHRDYAAAVTLCETWPDDARLEKLAVCFLETDHKFAAEGSRTIPQFLALASWCDGQLSAWEAKQGRT